MAPRRSGKVRVHELRVDNHSAGAQDDGDPHSHSHIKTQSIITYAIEENMEVDLTLYDLAKCFDSMWYHETMNDLWDA